MKEEGGVAVLPWPFLWDGPPSEAWRPARTDS